MKRTILLLCSIFIPIISYSQNDSLVYQNIEQAYGKKIYVTTQGLSGAKAIAAESTLIEKKPGKYKKVKVSKQNPERIEELPRFFNGIYYSVLGEISYNEVTYVRFCYENSRQEVIFLVPKETINTHLIDIMLNLDGIEREVKQICNKYIFLEELKANSVLAKYAFNQKGELQLGTLTDNSFNFAINMNKYCNIEWTGFSINDDNQSPYKIEANVGEIHFWIGYNKIHHLINDGALVDITEIEKQKREVAIREVIRDSLDRIHDQQVFLGIHFDDSVAFYACEGNWSSRKYKGYCNGEDKTFGHWEVILDNEEDDSYLQRRGNDGVDTRRRAARLYDSIMTIRIKQERLEQEKMAQQVREKEQKSIDSTLRVYKQKQIFIWNQKYAYGDYGRFGLEWIFFNCFNKVIKYIEITIKPYNQVGDIQSDDIGRKEAKARCIGPIEVGETASFSFDNLFWDDNDIIHKLIVTYIKIIFMDNTSKVYSGSENIKKRMLLNN